MGLQDITVVLATRVEALSIDAFLTSVPPNVPLVGVDASRDGTPDMIDQPLTPNIQVAREPFDRHQGASAQLAAAENWLAPMRRRRR
jgi:hypothetical protein